MALKDALQFFNKIQKEDSFRASFELANCLLEDEVIDFAGRHGFFFTKEEFNQAFNKNYDMRWMVMIGMKPKSK